MKRKMSDRTKLSISNANHSRLLKKNYSNFLNDSSERNAEKAIIKVWYHQSVVSEQNLLKRVLTKGERRKIFLKQQKQLEQNKRRYR